MSDSFSELQFHPLETRSEAFNRLYDEWLLSQAFYALDALDCVDLSECAKYNPLPWHLGEHPENAIVDKFNNPVIIRDNRLVPPNETTCRAIVECVNTIWTLQKKRKESMYNKRTGEKVVESEVRAKVYDLLGAWQSEYAAHALSGEHVDQFIITDNTVLRGKYENGCLGMDELEFVELIVELEDHFWVVVTEADIDKMKTVGDLIKVVAGTP